MAKYIDNLTGNFGILLHVSKICSRCLKLLHIWWSNCYNVIDIDSDDVMDVCLCVIPLCYPIKICSTIYHGVYIETEEKQKINLIPIK